MKLSSLIPPADLLAKFSGLEAGLRRQRALNRYGWIGGILAAVSPLVEIARQAASVPGWTAGLGAVGVGWWLLAALAFVLFFLATWFRFWLKESTHPIRYTCSLGSFAFVGAADKPADAMAQKMAWLPHDIAHFLNERVGRMLFLRDTSAAKSLATADAAADRPSTQAVQIVVAREADARKPPADADPAADAPRAADQHVHIDGHYLVRRSADADSGDTGAPFAWEIVVMPRVRIGAAGRPEKLSLRVVYPVKGAEPVPTEEDYMQLIEQVYFSVVSEVYRQIREDVERKIALLPTLRHQAVAYLHEAEDYARSNTLRAYEEASELYLKAARCCEPFNPLVVTLRRNVWLRDIGTLGHLLKSRLRLVLARIRPDMYRHELLAARAKLGYANMLAFKRQLSTLLGQRIVPIYAARPVAASALAHLEKMPVPRDAPVHRDYTQCVFDAHVTCALVWFQLGDSERGDQHLRQAEALDPTLTTTAAVYLLASSLRPANPSTGTAYETLLRAVERDPSLEVAQFATAHEREMKWRRGPDPVAAVVEAALVVEGYRKVLRHNPGNIGAAANAAFVLWVLGGADDVRQAEALLRRALRYKDLAPETVLSEQHLDLARIHAEWGNFEVALRHLVKAEDERRAHYGTHNVTAEHYFFTPMGDALWDRYRRYCRSVLKVARGNRSPSVDKVCAFALDEFAMACWYHCQRVPEQASWPTDDMERMRRRALALLRRSVRRDPKSVMAWYHLAATCGDTERRAGYLARAASLDPDWPDVSLELAAMKVQEARDLFREAQLYRQDVGTLNGIARVQQEIEEIEQRQQRSRMAASGTDPDPSAIAKLKGMSAEIDNLAKNLKRTELKRPTRAVVVTELEVACETKAADRFGSMEDLRKVAQEEVGRFLPHRWLWQPAPDGQAGRNAARFNWPCVTDAPAHREARWERQLSDLQAWALLNWVQPLLLQRQQDERPVALLRLIRDKFFAQDERVAWLEWTSETQPERKALRLEDLLRIVQGKLRNDPTSLDTLRWLDRPPVYLPIKQRSALIETAQQVRFVPPALCRPLVQHLLQEADSLIVRGDVDRAAQDCRAAFEVEADAPDEKAEAAGKLAVLRLHQGNLQEAQALIEPSLPGVYRFLPSAIKEPHGDVEKFLAKDESARLLLKIGYERLLRRSGEKSRHGVDAVMGLLDVAAKFQPPEAAPDHHMNVRIPLAVEWTMAALNAEGEDQLMSEALSLRLRLEQTYGVRVPGIRFRMPGEDVAVDRYRIFDHEVMVEEGTLPAADAGAQGPAAEQQAQQFVLQRLERYLERHLVRWIRVQEVQNLLETKCAHRYSYKIADSIPEFETQSHIGPLTTVVRALVAERVPIGEFAAIYETYRSLWEKGEPSQTMVRAIRAMSDIRPRLWGNATQHRRYVLSDTAERELAQACGSCGGFTTLVLRPAQRDALIAALRAAVGQTEPASLTVRNIDLRALLRRLIENDLPDMPVLHEGELERAVRAIEAIEIPVAGNAATGEAAT